MKDIKTYEIPKVEVITLQPRRVLEDFSINRGELYGNLEDPEMVP